MAEPLLLTQRFWVGIYAGSLFKLDDEQVDNVNGDDLVRMLATLCNPHRLRVIAALLTGRRWRTRLGELLRATLICLPLKSIEVALSHVRLVGT